MYYLPYIDLADSFIKENRLYCLLLILLYFTLIISIAYMGRYILKRMGY